MKLVKDQFVKCVSTGIDEWFIAGRLYLVHSNECGLYIESESNTKWFQDTMISLKMLGYDFAPADPSPLKVGDLVEVVRAPFESSNLKEGDRLTVTEVTDNGKFVNLVDKEGNKQECWYADRFTVVSSTSTDDNQRNDLKKALESALSALNEYENAKIKLNLAQDKVKALLEGSK